MSGHPHKTSHDAVPHDYNGEWAEADFIAPGASPVAPAPGARPVAPSPSGAGSEAAAKVTVSIRLGRDVLDHFRAAGPGWEARIEAALYRAAAAEREAAASEPDATPRHDFVSDGHEG
ncbi:BrnA antitoxin family protein [Labrys wisconsinensis]|uniref:Uncharacterized protein (DUF4415 family) n=1 Tax=Labrys wisconsinensis TaxID=425677 RepID=A0ABU0J775_9HYPH|nr:BrnA antitoxin family protein [Labrys wisconsinensis]MDQ0469037.1 uncharacterized protein (DUF4415 family) [Labrys wisconsinensis]